MNEKLEYGDLVLKKNKSELEYIRMWRDARDFDTDRFNEYDELMAYYEGKQNQLPQNLTIQPWVIKMDTPYAADAINIRISSLMANDYVGEIEPTSPKDTETFTKLNFAHKGIWQEMNMDNLINDAILRAAVVREAYIHVLFEDKVVGKGQRSRIGRQRAYFLDPSAVAIDPKSLDFRTADYVVVTERVTKRQVLEAYPDFAEVRDMSAGTDPMDRGEIYTGTDYTSSQGTILRKLTFYERTEDGVYRTVLVEDKFAQKPKKMPINVIPIAQFRWEKRIKSPYGISLMDRLLSLQKSVNAVESAIATAALAYASPSYVVRKDSGINPARVAKLAGAPGVVFASNGDPSTAIVPISIKGVDAQLPVIKQDIQMGIYKMAGITDEFLGNLGTAGNTAGGAQQATARSRVIENKTLVNLEEFVEDLTLINIEFITKAYQGETIFTRSEKKATGKFDFNEMPVTPEMEDIDYTFYIDLDVKTPYSRENTKMLLQELYQFERQYDAPTKVINVLDILKNYNVPNVQELVERYEIMTQRDTQMKANLIAQWVAITSKNGINADIITQGITEIIVGEETPTVDQTAQRIEQMQKQQQAQAMAMQQGAIAKGTGLQEKLMMEKEAALKAGPTGNEVYAAEGGNPASPAPTGDEVFESVK